MLPEVVGSTVRTIAAAGAGYLVNKGFIDAASTEVVVGIVIGVVTLAWSIWQKKRAKDAAS
jgi:hypothetical protein